MSSKTPKANAKKTKSAPDQYRLRRRFFSLFGLVLAASVLIIIFLQYQKSDNQPLKFGGYNLRVEKVDSSRSRMTGLSGRPDISDAEGMLFVFDHADKHCFWMKDMSFPIDIIWLDDARKVIHIAANVPPESFPHSFCPPEDSRYVLEVQAGLSERAGVDVGTQL